MAGLVALLLRASVAPAQAPMSLVAVSPIVEREVASGQTFVGTIMPLRMAIIGSAVDGRVVEFPLDEGDRVERGQAVAQLLTETITLELESAEAELEFRRQALAELENGTRPAELEQARSRVVASEARVRFINARRTRAQNLAATPGAITAEELDEIASLAIEAEQAHFQAQQAYQLAVEGPRQEQVAQARAQVAMQQATVNRLKDQLTKHTIISRFAGYVTRQHTEIGQWVRQGDPVAEVAALDQVEVVAQVVEQFVRFIRPGMDVTVDVPAIPGRPFAGKVSAVVPQADLQARTFPVKVLVQNEIVDDEPLLKSGMYVRVMLPTGSRRMATLVPKDALVLGGPQPMVYVVDSGSSDAQQGKARAVPVQVGLSVNSLIQVTGDLEPGQRVVVAGNERLMPGADVQIQRTIQVSDPTAENALPSAEPS